MNTYGTSSQGRVKTVYAKCDGIEYEVEFKGAVAAVEEHDPYGIGGGSCIDYNDEAIEIEIVCVQEIGEDEWFERDFNELPKETREAILNACKDAFEPDEFSGW